LLTQPYSYFMSPWLHLCILEQLKNFCGFCLWVFVGRLLLLSSGTGVQPHSTVGCLDSEHLGMSWSVFPLSRKKPALLALFLDTSRQKFWKLAFANLDAISSTGENFIKQNFVIFSKMCGTYFHDSSRSQVAVWIYSSERWKKVQPQFRNSPLASLYKSSGGNFAIYASKNEAVCCEVQTYFGSFRFARFVKKVLGAFSRFVRPVMKLFSAKFRRISEVFTLRGI